MDYRRHCCNILLYDYVLKGIMTPQIKEMVEKKAMELFEYMNNPLLWECADQDKKCKVRFIRLSCHVLASELTARIDEIAKYKPSRHDAVFAFDEPQKPIRIKELQEQLKELEGK